MSKRVLVVDDEKGYCDMLETFLRNYGYATDTAMDGNEAESLLNKEKYDIATAVGSTLVDQIKQFNPDFVVCDSETCRWNIEDKTSVPSIHPVQLIMMAFGDFKPAQ